MIVLDTTIVNVAEVTALMGFKDSPEPATAHGLGRRREGAP